MVFLYNKPESYPIHESALKVVLHLRNTLIGFMRHMSVNFNMSLGFMRYLLVKYIMVTKQDLRFYVMILMISKPKLYPDTTPMLTVHPCNDVFRKINLCLIQR